MSGDERKFGEIEVHLAPIVMSSSTVAPRKLDVQMMFKTAKEMAGRDVEWIWTDEKKGRTYRLVGSYPVIKTRDFWDYELRDDPTWTLSDDRDHGNPILWHYKTADMDLVFEITRMIEKKPGRGDGSVTGSFSASSTDLSPIVELPQVTDSLVENLYSPTGLYSYSTFLLFLQREFHWFQAYGSPLSLIVFDIKIPNQNPNDKPHWLPQDLVGLLNRRVVRRLIDTFGHFESFDFGLILPFTDTRQATSIAQRVSQILTKLPLVREKPSSQLIVKAGVANLPANGQDLASLIYAAKTAKTQANDHRLPIVVARADQPLRLPEEAKLKKAAEESNQADARMGLRGLLIRSALVNEDYMNNVMSMTRRMPLGRVLELEGHCKEVTVEAATELEKMMRGGFISADDAIRTLQLVGNHELDLDTALKRIGVIKGGLNPNEFAQLLHDSGLITIAQRDKARREACFTALPVGTVLVNAGILSETMLKAALGAERLVRHGNLAYEDAVKALDEMRVRGGSLSEVLATQGGPTPKPGVAETLVRMGKLSETEMMVACELEVTSARALDQILLQCGFVTIESIEQAKAILEKEAVKKPT